MLAFNVTVCKCPVGGTIPTQLRWMVSPKHRLPSSKCPISACYDKRRESWRCQNALGSRIFHRNEDIFWGNKKQKQKRVYWFFRLLINPNPTVHIEGLPFSFNGFVGGQVYGQHLTLKPIPHERFRVVQRWLLGHVPHRWRRSIWVHVLRVIGPTNRGKKTRVDIITLKNKTHFAHAHFSNALVCLCTCVIGKVIRGRQGYRSDANHYNQWLTNTRVSHWPWSRSKSGDHKLCRQQELQCQGWMPRLDAKAGCQGWMPRLDAATFWLHNLELHHSATWHSEALRSTASVLLLNLQVVQNDRRGREQNDPSESKIVLTKL